MTRAMILAAGRGERMGALTANTPKALLKVAGRCLIEFSLALLVKRGIQDIVINVSYEAEQIKDALGDGSRYGVAIHYSFEKEALETGGGILQALPYLGPEPFIVLSCDVISDYPLERLPPKLNGLAHLILVDNPDFHPHGDFSLIDNRVCLPTLDRFTFGNIGLYHPDLFNEAQPGCFPLGPLLKKAASQDQVTGEYYRGVWHNIGTPEQLATVETLLLNNL